jgi:flagellar basal-body rod protein FlgC
VSLFGALPISESGMVVDQTWLDAVAGNIANANDVVPPNQPAYQARFIVAAPVEELPTPGQVPVGQGVEVAAIDYGSPNGVLVYDPTNPLADNEGLVKVPDVRLGDQLVEAVMAQTGYQANVQAANRAKTAYEAALSLGS